MNFSPKLIRLFLFLCKNNQTLKPLLKIICFLLFFLVSYAGLSQTSITSPNKHFLFKHYTTQNGLIDMRAWAMVQDKNGYLWIGFDSGLSRFDGKTFYHKIYPKCDYLAPFVNLLKTTDGNIIFTSWEQGVFVQQNNGQFKQYQDTRNYWISLKHCRDGKTLVASNDAIYFITPDSLQPHYIFDIKGLLSTMEVDKKNRIWFGSDRYGLGILQPDGSSYKPVFLPEFKDKMVIQILFDDEGTLHVATYQGYYRIKWSSSARWITIR